MLGIDWKSLLGVNFIWIQKYKYDFYKWICKVRGIQNKNEQRQVYESIWCTRVLNSSQMPLFDFPPKTWKLIWISDF